MKYIGRTARSGPQLVACSDQADFPFVISGFNLEVQLLSIVPGFGLVPQSGYVLQPRVAASATLGLELNGQPYRNAVAARGRNPDATPSGLETTWLSNPG